jgi:hypothetical protein
MSCGPVPREHLIETVDWVVSGESREDIGEIGLWIDAVQFAGFDQRSEDCPLLATPVGICEQRVLAIEGERTDGALDGVAEVEGSSGPFLDAPSQATDRRKSRPRPCVFRCLSDSKASRQSPSRSSVVRGIERLQEIYDPLGYLDGLVMCLAKGLTVTALNRRILSLLNSHP